MGREKQMDLSRWVERPKIEKRTAFLFGDIPADPPVVLWIIYAELVDGTLKEPGMAFSHEEKEAMVAYYQESPNWIFHYCMPYEPKRNAP